MMKLRQASHASPTSRSPRPHDAEGGGAVACAAAAPLIVLALAVAADHAHAARFRTQVQLAAEAASLAAAAAMARQPDGAGDRRPPRRSPFSPATRPSGATGKPSVAATSRAATVTATVGYDGVAPSNFGSAFGYAAFHVSASATSHALVADSEARATP